LAGDNLQVEWDKARSPEIYGREAGQHKKGVRNWNLQRLE
jgi:hypothetical protein